MEVFLPVVVSADRREVSEPDAGGRRQGDEPLRRRAPLTYHYTGFVNGEDPTSAGIVASIGLATTGTSTSPAGYYPIVPAVNSFTAANYAWAGRRTGR